MSTATEYLQSYSGYFWRYEDGGKVIAVPNGRTLGYTDRVIKDIVVQLAPLGLPRFGSLLLAIAATTAYGNDTIDDILTIVRSRGVQGNEVENGTWFAKSLAQVPNQVKQGNLRILLLRAIFTGSHGSTSVKKSDQILKELSAESSVTQYTTAWREQELTERERIIRLTDDFKTLALIGRELKDVRAIMKRIANLPSLTHAISELEVEATPKEQDGLIDELLDQRDTFYVGALVSRLISGLQISFRASLPSVQPLGGVADITNKGSFDKLLTSEYAFDDHVLLSRLANSEALYKHREAPPTDNVNPRVLLIDTTLKNWGTIRTIAFATALAIKEHPKNRLPSRVFVIGKSYREIAVSTVMEVIDGLNALDGSLDPGVGLEELFSQEDLRGNEVFFLGTEASLASPGMQRLAAASAKHIDHWLHPDAGGTLRVYKNLKRGKRFVQELKLPLEKLWAKPRNWKVRKANRAVAGAAGYPILFPEVKMKATWTGTRFTYGVTKRKALMRLYGGRATSKYGWEFIADGIRPKDNLKAVITHEDFSVSTLFLADTKEYSVVKYPSGKRVMVALDRRLSQAKSFTVEDGCFKSDLLQPALGITAEGILVEGTVTLRKASRDKPYQYKGNNFFQHIRQVSITTDHKLRFRKHDLLLENNGIRIQHLLNQQEVKQDAVKVDDSTFTFADGSSVVHNLNGMLSLKSADPTIPDIFIPARLDVQLGVATADAFAGVDYYRKAPRIEVVIKDTTGIKLQLSKIINQCLNDVNMAKATEMAGSGIITCQNEASLARLESVLTDFPYSVERIGVPQQELSPTAFYEEYITPFIAHIVEHGTNA